MSQRRFRHYFIPKNVGTGAADWVELSTSEVAQAAALEITQLGLGSAPFALFIDQLLVPADRWFRWQGPLGQVRETKTALSGLFGRFVARAYLTKYLGFTHYEPIRSDLQQLAGWPSYRVVRRHPGDLPDWVVGQVGDIAIAEAKGSHNGAGPDPSLAAAKKQVKRVDIAAGGTKLKVKRYAIATRWSVQNDPKLTSPWLVVHDPSDGERIPTPQEQSELFRSVALGHFAALLEGLQLNVVANQLRIAKAQAPADIDLDPADLVTVKVEGRDEVTMAGGVVTAFGVFALPRDGNLAAFRDAIVTISDGRALFLGVAASTLRQVAKGNLLARSYADLDIGDDETGYWKREREGIDGTLFAPLLSVTLSRSQAGKVPT